jgi:hypothetical protein
VSDEFLYQLREDPRPEFQVDLERRLAEMPEKEERLGRGLLPRQRPVFAGGLAVAAIAVAFTLPAVRAAAREFLDLFRIQRVAAVPVDTERLSRLQQSGVDLKALVGQQVEVIEPAVKPESVESPDLASSLAGVDVRQPKTLPKGAALADVSVGCPGAFRVRLDVAKLRSLAGLLGVDEVRIPDSWEGAVLEVHAPPVVALRYHRSDGDFVLMESRGPEVALPDGLDLAELGAFGLQMAGMSAGEARTFSRNIDWRSTLLLPIPAQGGSFREVDVQGRKGVLVTARHRQPPAADGTVRQGGWASVLFWADDDRVYALHGPGHGIDILEMAQSIG